MENCIQPKHIRILAIAPSSAGFGFAVLGGVDTLVDWGVKQVGGDKNAESLCRLKQLIAHYQPDVIVLPETSVKGCRRGLRIKALCKKILALASSRKIKVKTFSRDEVLRVFLGEDKWTKHELAEIMAQRFPQELGDRLPPKRKIWKSEDSRMDMFYAVALALIFGVKNANPTVPQRTNLNNK